VAHADGRKADDNHPIIHNGHQSAVDAGLSEFMILKYAQPIVVSIFEILSKCLGANTQKGSLFPTKHHADQVNRFAAAPVFLRIPAFPNLGNGTIETFFCFYVVLNHLEFKNKHLAFMQQYHVRPAVTSGFLYPDIT